MADHDERDADGNLTPWALACEALSDAGCDCDEAEPGTCLECLCEGAMWVERARAERAEAALAKACTTVDRLRGVLDVIERWTRSARASDYVLPGDMFTPRDTARLVCADVRRMLDLKGTPMTTLERVAPLGGFRP